MPLVLFSGGFSDVLLQLDSVWCKLGACTAGLWLFTAFKSVSGAASQLCSNLAQ
jgi:hypothetical protein